MYGKEFSSPQQTKNEKLNQPQRPQSGMRPSSSTQQLHRNQQPANLPSKYAKVESQQPQRQMQRSRPQSASVYKSQSQRSLYQGQNMQTIQNEQQYYKNQKAAAPSAQQQVKSKFLEREQTKVQNGKNSNQQKQPMKQDDEFSRASHQSFVNNQSALQTIPTEKFLKTNLDEYLKQDQGRCISCAECIKSQEKNLFYKYPSQMKTLYDKEYSKFDPNAKSRCFILDKERQSLRSPYKVQRDFTSTHKSEYRPFQVEPKKNAKHENDMFEVNHPCFIGATTYSKTYQNWGANPAMKPRKLQPHIIDMRINDKTTYRENFNSDQEKMPKFMKDHEEVMKKACVKKMQQGSLARHFDAPFLGKSVSHETFIKPRNIPSKEQYRPIDELFVANLPLKTESIHHTDYDAKKVDICSFTLNKKKPIFD